MLKTTPSPIPYIVGTIALLAGGYWWFYLQPSASNLPNQASGFTNSPPSSSAPAAFVAPKSVAGGTQIRVDGSTSMVTVNQNLKRAFETRFPGTQVIVKANGSNRGIQDLRAGRVDIAAISRPLTTPEMSQGLRSVPVASDAIALVVGVNNPFKGGLTAQQVEAIFQGNLTDWAEVGGKGGTIQVINRPEVSGTHQAFKDRVLKNSNFGTTANIKTLPQDATTPLLRALSQDWYRLCHLFSGGTTEDHSSGDDRWHAAE
ncbi:substrate-binding domain-containing protein [Kovacikia minuta CCNUW1]|uniref:substrate-binding domain-containing protein n=1 Tax=Kovacikia minuta TaxID=2931930 RepID=UPI001CCA109F|nr:substrate-binding domain-containing protein [Kovacikia minuta]UBF25434.1 substrate-binding domain-containing protein [Kovacikia minuta CCNUW1]